MTWLTFPFTVGPGDTDAKSLYISDSHERLTAFGVVHDAIDHGLLGYPFDIDGELAAIGAQIAWFDVAQRRDSNPTASLLSQALSSYPRLAWDDDATWPGLGRLSPRPEVHAALAQLPVEFTQLLHRRAAEMRDNCNMYPYTNPAPIAHEYAYSLMAAGLLGSLHHLMRGPHEHLHVDLMSRARWAIDAVQSLKDYVARAATIRRFGWQSAEEREQRVLSCAVQIKPAKAYGDMIRIRVVRFIADQMYRVHGCDPTMEGMELLDPTDC